MTTTISPEDAPEESPISKLLRLAFKAGRNPEIDSRTYAPKSDWLDFTFQQEIGELVSEIEGQSANHPADLESVSAEFERGQLEHKIALLPDGRGWIIVWTTAPADYDSFGAETITAEINAWHGKTLRSVAVDPRHANYQRDRYTSGINFVGDEDPRVEAERVEARRRTSDAEDRERDRRAAAARAFLLGLSDEALEHVSLDDGDERRDVTASMVREQRAARSAARHEASRKARWERDTATVPEGSTIVDDGTKGFRGTYGWIAGQPTRVLYAITYGQAWEKNVDTASVESSGYSLNLGELAEDIRAGHRYRIVDPSSVPPRAVVDRFGHENLKKIEKHAIGKRTVYTCRAHAWDDLTILGEDGKKVRGKKIEEELQGVFRRRDHEAAARPVLQGFVDFLKFAE